MNDINQKTLDFITNLTTILGRNKEEEIMHILSELREYNKNIGMYADKEDCTVIATNEVLSKLKLFEKNIISSNDIFNIYKIDGIDINKFDYLDIPRCDAECNPDYLQIVVGLIIKCNDNILLLSNIEGDMSGNMTLVQGHVDKSNTNEALSLKLKNNLIREFFEEINPQDCAKTFMDILNSTKPMLMIVPNKDNYSSISRFHIGIIYGIDVDEQSFYTLRSNEIKNELVYYNLKSFPCNSIEIFLDTWVLSLLNIIKP